MLSFPETGLEKSLYPSNKCRKQRAFKHKSNWYLNIFRDHHNNLISARKKMILGKRDGTGSRNLAYDTLRLSGVSEELYLVFWHGHF